MRILKYIIIIVAACCITACARQSHKNYCEESQTIKRITVPAGLSSTRIRDKYPTPAAKTTEQPLKPVSLIPPGVGTR
jgi:uncharacterized lipoprotein